MPSLFEAKSQHINLTMQTDLEENSARRIYIIKRSKDGAPILLRNCKNSSVVITEISEDGDTLNTNPV